MYMYGLRECEQLMDKYIEAGGEVVTLQEGTLGLGLVMCFGQGLKTTIIRERYLNCWSSGHTIRQYNVMPKKYEKMLNEVY